jgi:hypothetical protein
MKLKELHEELKDDYVTSFRNDKLCIAIYYKGEKHQVKAEQFGNQWELKVTNSRSHRVALAGHAMDYETLKQDILNLLQDGKSKKQKAGKA